MTAGTGTAGANQNGAYAGPAYTPGELITAAGPLSNNAAAPEIDITLGSQFVTKAYDLAVYPALRPQLIFDQLATVGATKLTHRGGSVRFSFVEDIADQTTPLLENLDVDSVSMSSKALTVSMSEYGTAVTTTNLLRGTSMVPIDPIAAERVGYNAGKSIDRLAKVALDAANVTYDDASTTAISQIGSSSDFLVLRCSRRAWLLWKRPTCVRSTATLTSWLFRPSRLSTSSLRIRTRAGVTSPLAKKELMGTPSTVEIGMYEGVRIIVNNNLGASNIAYLMGAEALAKVHSNAPGFGPNPATVVSPVVDKLRRFASIGWYHLVGYSVFRPEALIRIETAATLRP